MPFLPNRIQENGDLHLKIEDNILHPIEDELSIQPFEHFRNVGSLTHYKIFPKRYQVLYMNFKDIPDLQKIIESPGAIQTYVNQIDHQFRP